MSIAATSTTQPRSYLTPEERKALTQAGSENLVCVAESQRAALAGDDDTSWAWLARTVAPAHVLMSLKEGMGAQFIREHGFNTKLADAAYGANWLDR